MLRFERLLFFLALALASLGAWAFEFEGPFPTRDYPFAVKDSGVEVQVDAATVVEWLDNENVIFSALKPGEPRLQDYASREKKAYPGRVVVWNTRTGEVKEHSEGKLFCSNRGLVSTVWKDIDPKSGKLGSFAKYGYYGKEEIRPGWREGDPPRHRDWHTCIIHDGPPKNPAPDNWVFSLRESDGFIVLGPKKGLLGVKPEPVMLVRPDGARQALPLRFEEVKGVWWEDWAGVYFLAQLRYGGSVQPRQADTLPLLYPDGHVEQFPVPERYWRKNDTQLAAITKRGMIVTNEAMFVGALFPNKAQSGAYLLRGDKVVRLVDWLVGNERAALHNAHRGIAVSPDGCKVAFKHGAGERYKVEHTIKMIDVCEVN